MNKRNYELRVKPFISNTIGYLVIWIIFSLFCMSWNLIREYWIMLSILWLLGIYWSYLRIGLKVIYDITRKNYKTDEIKVINVRFDVLKDFPSKDLFSFTYMNPEVQRFRLKSKLVSSNKLINFRMYLTIKEVNSGLNLATENDTYEITYLKSSNVIVSIKKLELFKNSRNKKR